MNKMKLSLNINHRSMHSDLQHKKPINTCIQWNNLSVRQLNHVLFVHHDIPFLEYRSVPDHRLLANLFCYCCRCLKNEFPSFPRHHCLEKSLFVASKSRYQRVPQKKIFRRLEKLGGLNTRGLKYNTLLSSTCPLASAGIYKSIINEDYIHI